MGMALFPRGSEWRRWDLHVHTPASALANEFGDWDGYVDALEQKGANIAVLGVTDYCTIEGYKKLLEYRDSERLQSFQLIVPNIEFRIQPELPDGRGINIHLLISPDDPDHVAKVETALSHLTYRYDNNPYSCNRDGLSALGKAVDPNIKDDNQAFLQGVNVYKPGFDVFRGWYEDEGWLQENSMVVISNKKDGASGLSKDAGFKAEREELYRFADAIFSSNPKDRDYFLGEGTDAPAEVVRKCHSLKPCLHGSDAHDEGDLFEVDLNRCCWIKADPSFEGLLQTIHEPKERVWIGASPPQAVDESKIISCLRITDGERWFSNSEIILNPGLVAIIGEKGSGKTALGDLISYCSGAWDGEQSSSSFIQKATPFLRGISATVEWGDGTTSISALDAAPPKKLPEVRYLSQDFVEELCSADVSGARLIQEIEEVIFSHIDETDRLDAATFAELRTLTTGHIEARKATITEKLARLNKEIVRLEDEAASRDAKATRIKKIDEEIAAIEKQLPTLQETVNKDVAKALEEARQKLEAKSKEVASANRTLSRIKMARSKITEYKESVETQFNELASLLEEIGLSEDDRNRFRPEFAENFRVPLDTLETELKANVTSLSGDPDKPNPKGETIADLKAKIKGLEKQLAADEQQRKRLLALQRQRAKLVGERDRLQKEVERIGGVVTKEITRKRKERWTVYLSYFDALAEEQSALEQLYAPLSKVVEEDPTGAKSGFALSVRQVADHEKWVQAGSGLLDFRYRDIPLKDAEFIRKVQANLVEPWRVGDTKAIQTGLTEVAGEIGIEPKKIDTLLVSHADRADYYTWLFSPEHITLEYSLSYDGVDLEALSPGTRGIVLLVLYLEMDRDDKRPLLIDQPEGNLDNSSVYESLVPYLRRAKLTRQIVLVTHNPNLVVTADADQIIVASAKKKSSAKHPTLTYSSGSLENAGRRNTIREMAVRLLEGGREPFKVRGERYGEKRG